MKTLLFVASRAAVSSTCLFCLWMATLCGCETGGESGSPVTDNGPAEKTKTADGVLDNLFAAYAAAESYRDEAVVTVDFKLPEGDQQQQLKMHVSFQRPNRVRVERDGILVISDGETVHGRPNGWDGQVVVVSAPKRIQVPAFYNITSLMPLLQPGIEGNSIQLDLLAADEPLKGVRTPDTQLQLLSPERVGDRNCDRVQLSTTEGQLVLWVDQQSHVLHRVDYPTEGLKQQLAEQGVQDAVITAEFIGAELNPKTEKSTFQWAKHDDDVEVRNLVTPPNPQLKPHELIGQVPESFTLTTASGVKQDSQTLNGKITVIDFWATWCQWCIAGMPKFEAAYQRYADNDEVQFLALSVDELGVEDETIASKLSSAGGKMPWSRVAEDKPFDAILQRFQLGGIPAYVILDKQGRIQFRHIGGDLDMEKDLDSRIEALLAGQDLAAEAAAGWDEMQKQYDQQIQLMRADGVPVEIEIPRADVADRAEPDSLTLTESWTFSDAKAPGNLLVLEDSAGNAEEIVMMDGFRSIVRLAPDGALIERHDDLLPEKTVATFMRGWRTPEGKRWIVAGGLAQPRFYVFDAAWQQVLAYPEADTSQVYDVELTDLDADGEPELCVGYFSDAGVHGVAMDGKRIWRNRSISNISDIAAIDNQAGGRSVLCAHSFGTLIPFDKSGTAGEPVEIKNRAITHVAAADLDHDGVSEIAAIVVDADGKRGAVGIGPDGTQVWEQVLPAGEHKEPLETIAAADWFADQPGHWLFATADGAIHFISADGKLHDRFATGQQLTGMAATRVDGAALLLISSRAGVTALQVLNK